MRDILLTPPTDWLADPLVTELGAEAKWIVASTTQALFRKGVAADSAAEASQLRVEPNDLPGFRT